MAQNRIHCNLTNKTFPFLFNELSNTVVVNRGFEQNRQILPGFDREEPVQQFGICQTYFMRNVLPTNRGLSSVHFTQKIAGHGLPGVATDDAFLLRGDVSQVAIFSPAGGQNLIYDPAVGIWQANPIAYYVAANVTVANLKQVSYICFDGLGLYKYNFTSQALEVVPTTGLDVALIKGVAACNSYLLVWTDTQLFWSDPLTPTDFLPALGGAGSTALLANKSSILFVIPVTDNHVVVTNNNAIAGIYTGNANFPFRYKEIEGSAGIARAEHVAYDSNKEELLAWTSAGFQAMSLQKAEGEFTELSDSVARGVYSLADTTKNNFPQLVHTQQLTLKVTAVGSRYIVVSIRDSAVQNGMFQIAYVFDSSLRSWGRIDIPHSDVFEFRTPEFLTPTSWQNLVDAGTLLADLLNTSYADLLGDIENKTARLGDSLGFLNQAGEVYVALHAEDIRSGEVEASLSISGAAEPMLMIGRFKLYRDQGVTLQHFTSAGFDATDGTCWAFAHDYAGNYANSAQITAEHPQIPGTFYKKHVGDAISLGFFGKFNLTDLAITFSGGGTRNLPVFVPGSINTTNFVVGGGGNIVVAGVQVVVTP